MTVTFLVSFNQEAEIRMLSSNLEMGKDYLIFLSVEYLRGDS